MRFRLPEFLENRHMMLASLSVLCSGYLYRQKIFLVLISVRGRIDSTAIVLPEGIREWKISMIPSGNEPATFRLVAQCLTQLHILAIFKNMTTVEQIRHMLKLNYTYKN
jgi:hypothetical protein